MTTASLDEAQPISADHELWRKVIDCLPILADLSRSDLLLYAGDEYGAMTVIAQARPHSVSPIFTEPLVGQVVTEETDPGLFRALRRGRVIHDTHEVTERAIPSFQEIHPMRSEDPAQRVGALRIETNLLEHERHRRRSQVFQATLIWLQQMALSGALCSEDQLSPFGEHDGILVVDAGGVIRYVSGIATNLYRKVGHSENLVGTSVADLPSDARLCAEALDKGRCLEREFDEQGFIWIKKAIPIRAIESMGGLLGRLRSATPATDGHWGVLITVHDATEARRKERELRIKSAMIQEIHHRVKNNLQTIAALLRLQARRSESEEVQQILQITISRILSIAVVHEFLAQGEGTPINMKEIAHQVIHQLIRSIVDPEQQIQLNLYGDDVYLPAQQATSCALVINELIQNALEHGFADREGGAVVIRLHDQGETVRVEVMDNGIGLPAGFDVQRDGSLGLRIVQTLVEEDLKGALQLRDDHGVRAIVTFPKVPPSQALSPISDL